MQKLYRYQRYLFLNQSYILPQQQQQLKHFSKKVEKIPPTTTTSKDFNPFSVKLEGNQSEKEAPSTLQRLKEYFQFSKGEKEETKEKTVDDKYQELKKAGGGEIKTDAQKKQKILELIEKTINRKYFSEKKIDTFFEHCFSLQNPLAMLEEKKFYNFIYYDLKFIIQSIKQVDNLVQLMKFVIFFRVDQDPEIYELLADQIKKNMGRFKTDEILTILVNFSHSLSPESQAIFEVANDDFVFRLDSNFNAASRDIYLQPEDFPKIISTLTEHKQMSHELKQKILDYIEENISQFNYNILSELAVIYASKMDKNYKEAFFRQFKDKFLKELQFLDQEVFYKIIWSLAKSDMLKINEESGSEWSFIKAAVIKKVKDFDPKILTNILVISTIAKGTESELMSGDLFSTIESELILKMKSMNLTDLINLMWSAQEIQKGSEYFYSKLEEEIVARMRTIKDDDFQILIECYAEDKSKFSDKFLELLIRVIREKKDKFELKTLVYLIWSFSKIDFSGSIIKDLLIELRDYERLRESFGGLLQKSQCILLWTYTRDERLFDEEFLSKLCQSMINYSGPKFELDNFDLLLIIQSVMHMERSDQRENHNFLKIFHQLATQAETFAIKSFDRMSIQEFTTIMLFYLQHNEMLSQPLLDKLIAKLEDSVGEFNEFQLSLFLKAIIQFAIKNSKKYDRTKFEKVVDAIDLELEGIQQEKEFIISEDKIRDVIRQQIQLRFGEEEGRPFRSTGTEQDSKLDRQIPKGKTQEEAAEFDLGQEQEAAVEQEDEKEIQRPKYEQQFNKTDQQKQTASSKTEEEPIKQEEKSPEEEKLDDNVEEKLKKYLLNRKRK